MKIVARSKWFSILAATARDEIITCADEVLVAALDAEESLLFVEETAFAFGGTQLFLPGGEMKSGESVLDVAQRELREETGFGSSKLEYLGKIRPWPKYLQVTSHIVRGSGLYAAPLTPDERHPMKLHRKTRSEMDALIASGEVCDARIIAALRLCFGAT